MPEERWARKVIRIGGAEFGLLAAGCALAWCSLRVADGPITSEDGATYLLLARAMESGHGHTSTWIPGQPPHVRYPPGYPVLLAGAERLAGQGLSTVRSVSVIFTLAGLATAYALFRILLGQGGALACCLFLLAAPTLWRFASAPLSEAATQTLVLASLAAGEAWARRGRGAALLGVGLGLAAVSFAFRVAGLALLGAWIVTVARSRDAVDRRGRFVRTLAAGALVCLSCVAWYAWSCRGEAEERNAYAQWVLRAEFRSLDSPEAGWSDVANRAAGNLSQYFRGATDELFHHFQKVGPAETPLRLLATAVLALGAVRLIRRGHVLSVAWGAAHFAILLLVPDYEGGRYLYPLLPVIAVCAWEGTTILVRRRRSVTWVVMVTLVASAGRVTWGQLSSPPRPSEGMERYLHAARFLGKAGGAPRVVLCRKPAVLALESGLPAVAYPYTTRAETHLERIRSTEAGWIVVDEVDREAGRFLEPVLPLLPIDVPAAFTEGGTRVHALRVP